MAISWTTALGAQDDSIEGMLARRDMSKQIQQLAQLAKQQEDVRQFDEGHKLDRERLIENVRLREAQQKATETQREIMQKEREADNKRALYGSYTSGRKPGDKVGKSVLDVIQEFEGGTGDYTQDPNDPMQFVYKVQEAQAALAKAEAEKAADEERRKFAREDQALQREANERARKAEERAQAQEQRRVADEERRKEKHQKAVEKAVKDAQALPGHLRSQYNKLVEDIMKENDGVFMGFGPDGEFAKREHAMAEALRRLQKQVPGAVTVPPLTGATPPKETPEQRFKRLMEAAKGGV